MTPLDALLAELAAIDGAEALVTVETDAEISVALPAALRHELPLDDRLSEHPGDRVAFRVDDFEDVAAALELVRRALDAGR